MKKNKIALFILGLTGAFSLSVNAVTMPEPLPSFDEKVENLDKAEEPKIELIDVSTALKEIEEQIKTTETEQSLNLESQARALLAKEKVKTEILSQKAAQQSIIEAQNKQILDRHKRENDVKEKIVEEKKKEEERAVEQMQELAPPPAIPDAVSVLSVYGTNNNLFAEIKVNNNKYQLQKGQKFGDGYVAVDINKDGVKISRNDVEQFINVSANPTMLMTPQIMEPVSMPNIIKPNQIR